MSQTSLLRSALLLFAFGNGLAAQGQAKPQPQLHYQIVGTLVSSVDGTPIAHGHLVPSLVENNSRTRRRSPFPAPVAAFDTDENGRFLIPLPSAGAWHLTASARGFTHQEYQQHGQFSTAVVLTDSVPSVSIRFLLGPEASITGAVLDEAGEPVRKAEVSLVKVDRPIPGQADRKSAPQSMTMTDDRGEYEFDGLLPGDYRICVVARPWYAVAAQSEPGRTTSLDPSLDVTYAPTWYPGVDNPNAAEMLTLSAGDRVEADLRLLPIPSVHLLIAPQANANSDSQGRFVPFPMVQRVDSETGLRSFLPTSISRNVRGQIDVGGLSPGLYRVQLAGPSQNDRSTVVRLNAGPNQSIDLDHESSDANVSLHIGGLPAWETGSIRVNLLDPESGRAVVQSDGREGVHRGEDASAHDRTFEVPPGQYEITVGGQPDVYLSGVSVRNATAVGRIVTLEAGDCDLMLHIAEGRARLTGYASFTGKPSVGAMVLLVPASLGDPEALTIVRRDQTNTDGSYDLREIIPGQYILIAIDQGWQINWGDPSTLRRYLMQGVPLNLTSASEVKQNLAAQAP